MTRPEWKRVVRAGVVAASLVNLAMLHWWTGILDPAGASAAGGWPTTETCWAAVTVCILAFLGGALASACTGPAPSPLVKATSELLLLSSGLMVADAFRLFFGLTLPEVESQLLRLGVAPPVLGLALLLGAVLFWRDRLARLYSFLLLLVSPFIIATVGGAIVVATRTDFAALDPTPRSAVQNAPGVGMRVVVVLFDEMDYEFAFSSRPPTLRLPAFDQLKEKAFFATDAHSPGKSTMTSIPSLLVGRVVDSIVSTTAGETVAMLAGDSLPRDLREEPTVFDDAFGLGARSEIVGFHIPYCRWALAEKVERCTWRPLSEGGVFDGPVGFGRAVLRQLLAIAVIGNRIEQIDRIRSLSEAGIRAAADPSLRLAFIHLPVPHFPSVWDEGSEQFTLLKFRTSSYFENLALADHELARILDGVSQAGLESRTIFVVTSDHPWRFGAIEGIAPGNRVPFVVGFPDRIPVLWTERLETSRLRPLVGALLSGEIGSAPDLVSWVARPSG